jgi:hypothetical protein
MIEQVEANMGTDFLFARPSFSGGMAAVMDLCGILVSEYNRSPTPQEADFRALRSDWTIIGMDLSSVINEIKTNYNVKKA